MVSITNVSFNIWSPASILESSVVAVETEEDLNNPRLGVIFEGKCPTCFQTKHDCPGHFGSLTLAEPVYHILWKDHLLRLLKSKEGKFAWDKTRSCITRDGELFPAYKMFEFFENPPVISVLPIPPPHVRPSLFVSGELKGENDLTYRLQNIIRKSKQLSKVKKCKRPEEVIQQAREHLQNAVTGYIHHEKLGSSRRARNKREYASCASRLSRKGGRIRSNLMGKRSNFTSRCVITGDDSLKLTEVGVPVSVSRTLTVPEKVTDYNKNALQKLVDAGEFKYIVLGNGSRSSKQTLLETGVTVERFLRDGDVVILNRQPSLHKNSLMGHYVRILPYSTFRINVADTSPYNADFDGDEMNIHVPQTLAARCETEQIMGVKFNVISPQANAPVIGLIQDALLGVYLLSSDVLLPHQAMQIAQCPTGCTGREIISTVMPPSLTYERGDVKIIEGRFLEGKLTKRDVGKSRGSLVQIIFNDFGPDVCVEFMFQLQSIAHRYLQVRGFTIGICDLVRSEEADVACRLEKEAAFRDALTVEHPNARLNACRAVMGKIVMKNMDDSNNFYAMVKSGSKGSIVNITQVQACLGQMNVQGGRMPKQWTDRTSTEFARGENTPESRGFVSSSYLEGLMPFEMFAHSMSGREGLIDTAIKTAQTGYCERKLMKCLENIKVHEDGTVRDRQRLIQFKYGDDGFDAMRIETQHVKPLPGANPADMELLKDDTYHFPVPIHRIVRRMRLFGGVGNTCGNPVEIDSDNILLRAFINVHTPTMTSYTRVRYEMEIKKYLDRANICPGEAVGAVAAQSIGERTTQCTLNSVDYSEWMFIRGYPLDACIGKIIDDIMLKYGYEIANGSNGSKNSKSSSKSSSKGSKRSKDLKDVKDSSHVTKVSGLSVLSITKDGKACWREVTHVTRHPPREYHGSSLLVKITLESGRVMVASRAKSFLVLESSLKSSLKNISSKQSCNVVPVNGDEIRVGLKVPVLSLIQSKEHGFSSLGGFLGAFYASGEIENGAILLPLKAMQFMRFTIGRFKPVLSYVGNKVKIFSERLYYLITGCGDFPMLVHTLSSDARQNFCIAYISLAGIDDEGFKCVPASGPMRDGLASLLDSFGVTSVLSSKGLLLSPGAFDTLYKCHEEKTEHVRFEEITRVEHVPSSHEFVYDLTVRGTKNMALLNGIACRDTFHFAGIGSKNVTLGIPRLQEILRCSKHPKTPLTTIKDKKALQLKYDCIRDLQLEEEKTDTLGNYWLFPDKGLTHDIAELRWGKPTRLVLRADVDIISMFEYAAYNKVGDRLIVDVYGNVPESRGVPGAEWCKIIDGRVETTLQDLAEIMLVCDHVNTLYTNDICKMAAIYGIECARSCVIIEIRKILDHYGIYINVRHLLVLIDAMTHTGKLTPLTRHGLKQSDASALKRCTFEEVVTVLHEAALKNEVDRVDEVSSCILTGKVAHIGGQTVTVLKDHVIEKKYEVKRPSDEHVGVDLWEPVQWMSNSKPDEDEKMDDAWAEWNT